MKKFIISVIFSLLAISTLYAQAGPTEQDYQNLDQMREKLMRLRREMDRFMKDVIVNPGDQAGKMAAFGQDVRVDVSENDKEIIVKADLPGMSKDKIDITLENNRLLKISGSREAITKQKSPGIVKQERMSGRFERILELPADCESRGIKATYNEGVLEIVLPKKKNVSEETIKVNVQ
jgi:HSP20 family protein